ncbi:LiaF domain-containing protein [Thalassotalea eurytherma]|uniref:Cell wall-active antibiotics response LiaF-like C-terminal domain-containing protein n=1 Tax=Thalassotalea eurytherma TaxID=1144278 RepID=A0ABQ6H1D5_9GAMM|nr:LiaF domain-containing protein [Thalassotalea eurytherma]GLX80627.1 hypothetical protein theurythT_00790 [Thalassotalea eurytherma]
MTSVTLEDRPIEQVREEVIDKLIYNYSRGVISAEAFERRLDDAMASDDHQKIVDLAADLPMQADSSFKQQKDESFSINYTKSPSSESLKLKTILSKNERSGRWQVPQEINSTNILGSDVLDFTDAEFSYQHVTLNLDCILGESVIYVPEGVNVVCEAFCFMGSIENKAPSISTRQSPTIVIKGNMWLGSVKVQIRRTIKEKFVSFANELKAMFDPKL